MNWFLKGEQDSLRDRGDSLCGGPEAEDKGVFQKDHEMVGMKTNSTGTWAGASGEQSRVCVVK